MPSDGGARRNRTPGPSMVDTGGSRTRVNQDARSRAGLNDIDRESISSVSHPAHRVPAFARELEVAGSEKIRLPRAMGVAGGMDLGRRSMLQACRPPPSRWSTDWRETWCEGPASSPAVPSGARLRQGPCSSCWSWPVPNSSRPPALQPCRVLPCTDSGFEACSNRDPRCPSS